MTDVQQHQNGGNMGVKVYNLFVVITDLILLIVKWWIYTFESFYLIVVPPEEKDVSTDIVLVTGSGHGIGRELALQYAKTGAKVVCVDINENGNNETVKEVNSRGGKAFGYTCDITNRDKVIETCNKIKAEVGIISILVNNAGIMPARPFLQQTDVEIKKIFDVNVMAHFWLFQCLIPDMMEKNRGHIVALSSCAGLMGLENLVPYCGSKFAVRGIMEALSEEIRAKNLDIHFTSIYPYMVDTGLCKNTRMRFPNMMKMVKPEEAAAEIIQAQRRNVSELTIPKYLLFLNLYTRLFPTKASYLLKDFLDSNVEPDC